ncbi:hypothetical protein [Pseudodesulfovibrio tunisiensis]|uniref:hypothetical protein n=1 Tax=Pseudodesulfovibrio tunisiensis TaxID=463192 RepID=UPI001FB31A13|nr:hypothetical protein [Pseudodesulfovibrio tunisiensis]
MGLSFCNDDSLLRREVARVAEDRARLGLNGLVGGLECVVINTEPDRQKAAVRELLSSTGLEFDGAFEAQAVRTAVLRQDGGADFLVTSRKGLDNPFRAVNPAPKSEHLPNTRLETFVFQCPQLERYVDIQKERGVRFLTEGIVETDAYLFIQTEPSSFTGNSLGFIKWIDGREGKYQWEGAAPLVWHLGKPDRPHLADIRELDHAATRVRAEDRDKAIIEFMELTNYHFDFSIYVESLNSITNVARLSHDDYAMVFTSGIKPFQSADEAGPTEMFIHNYGTRVHHLAFRTENIERTHAALAEDGMEFLVDLVGSPEEGLKQTFSVPFENTLLVNEYIHRYGEFDGFFTRSNVTLLTKATENQ